MYLLGDYTSDGWQKLVSSRYNVLAAEYQRAFARKRRSFIRNNE